MLLKPEQALAWSATVARRQTFFDYSTMFIWKGLVEGWNDDILTMAESGGQTRDEPAENASKRPQTPWNDKEYDRKAWKVNFIHKTLNFTYCKASPLQTLVNRIFVTQRNTAYFLSSRAWASYG